LPRIRPALWRCGFAPEGRTPVEHDTFCISTWLARTDRNGTLAGFLKPDLSPAERAVAQVPLAGQTQLLWGSAGSLTGIPLQTRAWKEG